MKHFSSFLKAFQLPKVVSDLKVHLQHNNNNKPIEITATYVDDFH